MIRHLAMVLAVGLLATQAQAYEPREPRAWDRAAAWRASVSKETESHRAELRQLLRAGDSDASIELLKALDRNPDVSAPARERLLLDYVNELRQEPPRAVSDAVIEFLAQYPSTVYVPDADHPRASVPLFNIRAATTGLKNGWTRQEAAYEGAVLLSGDAHRLVDAFLASDSVPRQRGLIDALSTAAPAQRTAIAETALLGIEKQPQLVQLAGEAALLNHDSEYLGRLLTQAGGEGINRLLRRSAATFDTEQNARLLGAALDNGSAETAALAIAQLAPVLTGHAPSVDRLFGLLGHPETGSAAALALAGSTDPQILTRLETTVRVQAGSLAASRALLAIELMEAKLFRDVQ